MTNDYFNHVDNRVSPNTRALDSQINAIADEVAVGFDKIPDEQDLRGDVTNLATNTGSAIAMIANLSYVPSLTDGFQIYIRSALANDSNATLNLNSLGIKNIYNSDLTPIDEGAMAAGSISRLYYDQTGDVWVLGSNNSVWGKLSSSSSASEFCPGQTFTYASDTVWRVTGEDASAIYSAARRLRFYMGTATVHGQVTASTYNGVDTIITMEMDDGDLLDESITHACIISGIDGWQLVGGDPFAGTAIRDIAVGKISTTVWWVAVGDGGKIFTSVNKGASWIQQTSGTTTDLLCVMFDPVNVGFVVGGKAYFIYSSTDGTTWSGGYNAALDGAFSGNNGGDVPRIHWNDQGSNVIVSVGADANSYIFNGYCCASSGDLGVTWQNRHGNTAIGTGSYYGGICFISHGESDYTRGDYNTLTHDPSPGTDIDLIVLTGGDRWEEWVQLPSTDGYIVFSHWGQIFFSGSSRPDAASDWDPASVNPFDGFQVMKAAFSEALAGTACVCGEGARIARTVDGGDTWTMISTRLNVTAMVTGIAYSEDDLQFLAVNDIGQIALSSNGL